MLKSLHVKNLALIEEADINFDKGFTVLSGETGAGKSILLESIHLALGGRGSKDLIRTGKEFALVELTFVPENEMLKKQINDMGIWMEDSEIVISRKLTADKSLIRVNGETVSAVFARELGELLLDIHGQNEHQSLLKKNRHIAILDEYGKVETEELKNKISLDYKEYKNIIKALSNSEMDESSRLRELDYIEYEINEIEAAAVREGEEEELETEYARLSNGRNIIAGLGHAYDLITANSSDGASSKLGDAASELMSIEFDDRLKKIKEQLLILESETADVARDITDYLDDFSFDEETLHNTAERLDLIRDLEKKYGNSVQLIYKHLEEAKIRRDELLNMAENRDKLTLEKKKLEESMKEASTQLRKIRKKIAEKLKNDIISNLIELNFLQVVFDISFKEKNEFSADGMDEVEFVISMNKGEAAKSLENVASGGELSRIMLAIKTVLADTDYIETQIFDEIDAGISGITASCVSKKLRQIGSRRQVFCISHLPQIVAGADNHYLIEKHIEGEKTITTVEPLDEEGSIREIARILGGDMITDTTLNSAREMKNNR